MTADEGFLYVVDLGSGEVKIGRTTGPPKNRIAQYRKEGYIDGNHYATEHRIIDVSGGEEKVKLALKEYLSRGKEYFKCSFSHAASVVKSVYDDAEKYTEPIGNRNAITMQFIGTDKELYRWVIAQATKNRRSASAQVRFYLEHIKEGKIKVEGVGG